MSGSGLAIAAKRLGSVLLFAVMPVAAMFAILGATLHNHTFAFDFGGGLYGAGKAIVHGHNPYAPQFLAHLAALKRAGGDPRATFAVPVYPAPALLATVPLSFLPYRVAAGIFLALNLAAVAAGLRLLGVRDWRCYGLALACWPVMQGIRLGATSPLLVLAAACAWRWREGTYRAAAGAAAGIVAKVFIYPLAGWMLFTRRFRVLLSTAVIAALATLGGWAVMSFHGLSDYPRMLGDLSTIEQTQGISIVSAALGAGASLTVAKAISVLLTLALLFGAWWCAGRIEGDRRAFSLALMASLTASPVVWPHYLALVLVPIALVSPELSWLWFVPLLAYLAPGALTGGEFAKIAPYLGIEAIVIARACLPGGPRVRARATADDPVRPRSRTLRGRAREPVAT